MNSTGSSMTASIKRGEVFLVNFDPIIGSETKIMVNQNRAADKIRLYITRLISPKPFNSLIPPCFFFVFSP